MPTPLWHAWEETVGRDPAAEALVRARDGLPTSRAALSAGARRFSEAAPPRVEAGQIAAFALPNDRAWMECFLGLQRLGLVALPLDPSLPEGQQAKTAADLGAHWFVGRPPAKEWQPLSHAGPLLDGEVCLLKTTSGSTGQPRALAFTSANMLADGRQIAATMDLTPGDRNLGAIPFGHSYGLGNLVLPLLVQGTAIICSQEILPEPLAQQIRQFGATILPSVPAVLRALAASAGDASHLASLRRAISAGAPLRPEVARAFHGKFGRLIHNFYGSSETGGICFDRSGEASLTGRSVGAPLDGVGVELDAAGRVVVRGAAVVAPGEQVLADLGAWTAGGELALTGRALALANIGGKKVSPLEVERALRDLAGVTDAWVGVQTRAGGGGDFLLAAVETDLSIPEVRRALVERLPHWQVPRRLWITSRLPRTARGKLDRPEMEARCLGLA